MKFHRKTQKKMYLKASYEISQALVLHASARPLADIYLQLVHPTKAATKECIDHKRLAENTGSEPAHCGN